MTAPASAQESELIESRIDTLHVTGAGPFLIHPFLVEDSVGIVVRDVLQESSSFLLDLRQGYVTFLEVGPDSSFSFVARYQFIKLDLDSEYSLWPRATAPAQERSEQGASVPTPRLQTRGSITRGVLAGSNRDASIESGLRLQIQGEITPGVSVTAALTDENTPILPEGTTRRLDQFDRIYIQFESRYGRANLGDVDAVLSGSRYATLQRKLQGASVRTNWLESSSRVVSGGSFQSGAAVSRGLFRSQLLQIAEGVQGPYRLEGGKGERFILVLPASEKVYLDGRLLERGLQRDYTIDYTTGEVTFSPRNMMGSDKRVQVDFEYTTNQFTRTFAYAESQIGLGTYAGKPLFVLGVRGVREADGSQFSDEFGLNGADSLSIAAAGDAGAVSSGATPVEYDPEALFTQYFQTEIGPGNAVFEAVNRPPREGEKVYKVIFSFVGSGQGSYRRIGGVSNGIVYEHVGSGAGDYDPVRLLPIPTRQQLVDLSLRSVSIGGLKMEAEWAVSDHDKNRLSSLDAKDDVGRAHDLGLETPAVLLGGIASLRATGRISRRSASFVTFDRSRSIEFEREWNLPVISSDQTAALVPGSSELSRAVSLDLQAFDSTSVSWSREELHVGGLYQGDRSTIMARSTETRWPATTLQRRSVELLDEVAGVLSTWAHYQGRIEKASKDSRLLPFAEWEKEHRSNPTGVQAFSPDYEEYRAGIRFNSHLRSDEKGGSANGLLSANLYLEERRESGIEDGSKNSIRTLQAGIEYQPGSHFRNRFDVGWRQTRSLVNERDEKAKDALIVSLDGQATAGRSHRIRWFYQAQSERSATLQEIYIRTGQERGQFVWDDANGDNVIQLDEFIPETTPGEGEYVRTFFPGDSLESVTSVNASIRYEHLPLRNGSRLQQIRLRLFFEVDEKSRADSRSDLYLLRQSAYRVAGNTIRGKVRLGQTVSLLPLNRTSDVDLDVQQIRTMSDLASGLETGNNQIYSLRLRKDLGSQWSSSLKLSRSTEESASSRFASRSFEIRSTEVVPAFTFAMTENMSLTTSTLFSQKTDTKSSSTSRVFRLPLDLNMAVASKFSARAGLERSSVIVEGELSGLQSFEMTDGRGRGTSWLWHTTLETNLTDVVRATFGYSGRAPSVGNVIHTGRVQLSARF